MSSVTQYETDWRTQKLLKGDSAAVRSKSVIGVAKAGYIFQGGSQYSIQFFSGDVGSSVGMPIPNEGAALRMSVYVLSNNCDSPSIIYLRKNENNTSIFVTIPAAGTGLYTANGDVYIAPNERLDILLQAGGTTLQTIDIPAISVLLELW